MPKVRFKDINVHFEVHGTGPAVVLLHGFLEASWMWTEVVKEFRKRYKIVTIDLPGHGHSDCIGYVHSMEEMAEAVFAVVQEMKLRRIQVVGHSMGGYVALAFAEKWPDHVKNLVLYQTTAKADDAQKKLDRDRVIQLVKRHPKRFVRSSLPLLFRPVNRKKFRGEIQWLKERAMETPAQGIIAALAGMRDRPDRQILLRFPPYPVKVIAGDKDPRIPLEESKDLAATSDQVDLYVIKGSGHMSYIEDKVETNKAFRWALT